MANGSRRWHCRDEKGRREINVRKIAEFNNKDKTYGQEGDC